MRYGLRPASPCQICRPCSGASRHCQRKQRHNDLTAVADETRSAYPVIVLSDSSAALHVCQLAWDDDNAVLLCTSLWNGCFGCCCSSRPLAESFRPSGRTAHTHVRQDVMSGCFCVVRQQSRTLHPSIRPCFPSIPLPTDPPLIPTMFSRLPPLVVARLSECPYSYSEVVCRIIQRRPSRLGRRFAF